MIAALAYIGERFFYRIWRFLVHWYAGGFFAIGGQTTNMLEYLDRTLALRITLRYFFQPLYRDYSFIGYLIGIPSRTVRALAGVVAYGAVFAVAVAAYAGWAAIPLYLLRKVIFNL
ncbi:MAG: hypothetical protein HYZ07_02505 [Candidatus Harrisonbacteria bacterium]|nr:hypothetical protein [Candidatus Harrisonbacteria bacterium]